MDAGSSELEHKLTHAGFVRFYIFALLGGAEGAWFGQSCVLSPNRKGAVVAGWWFQSAAMQLKWLEKKKFPTTSGSLAIPGLRSTHTNSVCVCFAII